MKSINRIVILTLAAVVIVMFWLAPGINKATAVQYTRLYEDTDYTRVPKDTSKHKEKTVKPPKGPGKPKDELTKQARAKEYKAEKYDVKDDSYKTVKPSKKIYKSQTIRPKDKKFKLEAKMFSRAVQFVEEPLILDSAETVVVVDSASKASPF